MYICCPAKKLLTNTNYLEKVFRLHVPPAIGFIFGHVSTNFTRKLGFCFVRNDKRTPTSLMRTCNMKNFFDSRSFISILVIRMYNNIWVE